MHSLKFDYSPPPHTFGVHLLKHDEIVGGDDNVEIRGWEYKFR